MLTTIKVCVLCSQKIYKKQTKKYLNGVARARCAGPESTFVKLEIISFYFLFFMHDLWLAKGTIKNHN